jgi:hypothetical protein
MSTPEVHMNVNLKSTFMVYKSSLYCANIHYNWTAGSTHKGYWSIEYPIVWNALFFENWKRKKLSSLSLLNIRIF